MARDVEIERRLQSWARWKAGMTANGLGYATVQLGQAVFADRDRYRESTVPAMAAEAAETDALVLGLPSELRRTTEVMYLSGGTVERKATRLCCAVATLYSRVEAVHSALRLAIADRHRAAKAERNRVEALARQAVAGRGV